VDWPGIEVETWSRTHGPGGRVVDEHLSSRFVFTSDRDGNSCPKLLNMVQVEKGGLDHQWSCYVVYLILSVTAWCHRYTSRSSTGSSRAARLLLELQV